jgi:hypothetical protein
MALSIVLPQFFLPQTAIKLGRFITSIDHPHQGYHDPPYLQPPKIAVLPRNSYVGVNHKGTNASFGSALTSLISAGFSKRAKARIQVTAESIVTHTLDNSDEWFDGAVRMPATRVWIERALDRGNDIYMVVGYHTVTNARIIHESIRGKDVGGQVNVPVGLSLTAVSAIAPLGKITDPSIGGNSHDLDSTQSRFVAPGEQICAFQYRKVQHRWLSSSSIDTSRLSKSPRWSSVERGRDEEDGQDDIIEVEMIPAEELDGKWQRQEVPGGETLLIREDILGKEK